MISSKPSMPRNAASKRTVRAWACIEDGRLVTYDDNRFVVSVSTRRVGAVRNQRVVNGEGGHASVVPCTITYDDDASPRKSARARAGGKGGKRG